MTEPEQDDAQARSDAQAGSDAQPRDDPRDSDVAPSSDDGRGGSAVCWLERVCPACGALEDGPPAARCPRCGTARADDA